MPGAVQDVITPANFAKIGQGVLAWRGVEFWPLTQSCEGVIMTSLLSHELLQTPQYA